jgi:hypothetical protein
MAVAVPMAPDANPAVVAVTPFTGMVVVSTLIATASRTPAPRSTDSVSADTTAITAAPTTVPGMRPTVIQVTPARSSACHSRTAMTATSGITTSARVAGSASGSSTATTGTATILAPNPTEPWTIAPTVIAASAITYSSPDRWIASPPWQAAELR